MFLLKKIKFLIIKVKSNVLVIFKSEPQNFENYCRRKNNRQNDQNDKIIQEKCFPTLRQ